MAILSIRGLYLMDQTIFDGLELPKLSDIQTTAELIPNAPELNKDNLLTLLVARLAELSVVYPDPEMMKDYIRVWSATRFYTWLHLYETMLYKYNPIWNKDGSFTETRNLQRADQATSSGSGTMMHDVTGFDANGYSPDTQDRTQQSSSATGSGTEAETITRTEAGNIGVTMTQEMIQREREIVEFNLYDYIIQDFKKEFCIMVY